MYLKLIDLFFLELKFCRSQKF